MLKCFWSVGFSQYYIYNAHVLRIIERIIAKIARKVFKEGGTSGPFPLPLIVLLLFYYQQFIIFTRRINLSIFIFIVIFAHYTTNHNLC